MTHVPPTDGFSLRHEIFVLDAHLADVLDVSKYKEITNSLIDQLLASLGMEKLGDLQIYPATDLRAPGWSFIQPITTSHISGHYFEKPGRQPHIRLDVYSCETVDWRELIRVVHKNLSLADWRGTFLQRAIELDDPRTTLELSGKGDQVTSEIMLGTISQQSVPAAA